ncbi:hypothetical protein L2E82_34262 [Cichorium intybus]|uniref:Uncharacterized protein n=1 Tax=Cichorium intybus TaxID=13427 RepID=A0ACB9BLU8_CICIN|nr:hypothetical protein L2E82_34262 [Cichorium intybus]
MEKNDAANTRSMGFQFTGKDVYTAVWVAALSLFMELLGFSTKKWLTDGGLRTVLLTLVGRETRVQLTPTDQPMDVAWSVATTIPIVVCGGLTVVLRGWFS